MIHFLVVLYISYVLIKVMLSLLQMNFVSQNAKKEAVVLSEDEYKNAARILVTNQKFGLFTLCYDLVLFMVWIFWGLNELNKYIMTSDTMINNILFVMSFLLINFIIELPLGIYEKFVKDKKHGFSNMTAKIFIIDTLKSLLLTIIFGSLVVWLILFCFQKLGEFWWVWAFCLSFGIILIINLIYPTLIAPIFNKVKPLEDGELKSSIENLLNKCGFKSSGVFVMDASKRDNRLNAYFGGLGVTKRVVLFDTLIQKLSVDEIIAVLGHELGHFKHKDILKMIALSAVMLFFMFAIFGNISTPVYNSIGLSDNGASVLIFMLLFSGIFNFAFSPIMSYFSRQNEFGADKFGASIGQKNNMINALKKLGSENKAFPKAHPVYSCVYHSHPTLFERINELENDSR